MKKILSLILVFVFIFAFGGLNACNYNNEKNEEAIDVNANQNETVVNNNDSKQPEVEIIDATKDDIDQDDDADKDNVDNDVVQDVYKYKNLILFIGDGMGREHVKAGQLASGNHYEFTDWNHTMADTNSLNSARKALMVTDSAAAATALATGTLTQNGYVGKDYDGNDLVTIMDIARSMGKATGIVTTDVLSGATPSGFSAHNTSRSETEDLLDSQLNSGINLLCGYMSVQSMLRGISATKKGYQVCNNFSQIKNVMQYKKAYCNFDIGKSNPPIALSDVVEFAIDFLDDDEDGFVLMVEQAYIDKYSHDNAFSGMVDCVESLNDAVEVASNWASSREEETVIMVTADHETGGLKINDTKTGSVYKGDNGNDIYYSWGGGGHTSSKVWCYINIELDFKQYSSFDSEEKIKNTDINKIMKLLLAEKVEKPIPKS